MKYLEEKAILQSYFLKAAPRTWTSSENAQPIMVLSSGKCGTMTMTYLLNCSQNIMAYHEMPPRLWHLGDKVFKDKCRDEIWDTIYWASRRDIISVLEENEMRYVENNHRVSVFAPAAKRLMPKTRFVILWRDFEETVVSACRWGWYSPHDRTGEGRIRPPKDVTDIRKKVAWYWVNFYRWVLDFVKDIDDVVMMPFEAIKTHDIATIKNVFEQLETRIPDEKIIKEVLNEKYNAARHNQDVPKVWQEYDREAKEITERLREVAKP